MTDNNSNHSNHSNHRHSEVIKGHRIHRNYVVYVMGLAVLVGLASFSYFNYYKTTELNQLLDKKSVELSRLNNSVKQFELSSTQSQNSIKDLTASLNNVLAFEKQPLLQIELAITRNYINLADLKLKLDNDINAAILILNMAEQNIYNNASNQPELLNLRKNILIKISALSAVKTFDLIAVMALLEEYADRIENLKLIDFMMDPALNNETIMSDAQDPAQNYKLKNWRAVFTKAREDLFTLIKVRNVHNANKIERLLDDKQIDILKLYLALQVTEAKVNLLQHHDVLFNNNINNLINDMKLYFNNNKTVQQSLLELLKKIRDLNIKADNQADLMNLNDLINEVNSLYKKQ